MNQPQTDKIRWRQRRCYPKLISDIKSGNSKFVQLVTSILECFDFDDPTKCGEDERHFYKAIRELGAEVVYDKIMDFHDGSAVGQARINHLAGQLGRYVIDSLTPTQKEQFLPFNDVLIQPTGDALFVRISSLDRIRRGGWEFYCSPLRPRLTVEGGPKVAFARHVIERVCERLETYWRTYAGLGDAHAYFAHCRYFEPVLIRSKETGKFTQPAFSLFQSCFLKDLHPQMFSVPQAMWQRLARYSHPEKDWYYRVGYCPYDLVDGYAVAKTFLLPGFRATPEYVKLKACNVESSRKKEWLKRAESETFHNIYDPVDLEMIRWFHENSVPQVVTFDTSVFVSPLDGTSDLGDGIQETRFMRWKRRQAEKLENDGR
jgi:hypothetical protein